MAVLIRKLNEKDITTLALNLVWEVFLETEGTSYTEEGKLAFKNAIHDPEYISKLTAYGAFDGPSLVGVIASRNEGKHIALFFVKNGYRGKGIGRMLWEELRRNNKAQTISVHSSVYAAEIYKALGFKECGKRIEEDNIVYIPMTFSKDKC